MLSEYQIYILEQSSENPDPWQRRNLGHWLSCRGINITSTGAWIGFKISTCAFPRFLAICRYSLGRIPISASCFQRSHWFNLLKNYLIRVTNNLHIIFSWFKKYRGIFLGRVVGGGGVKIRLMFWASVTKRAEDVEELTDIQCCVYRWVPAYWVIPGHKLQLLPSFSNFKISH